MAEFLADKRFYEYQIDFLWGLFENVLNRTGQDLTALFSRQSGKSESVADGTAALVIALPLFANAFPDDERFNRVDSTGRYRGFKKGFRAGIYAPVKDQAKTTFDRLKEATSTEGAAALFRELGVHISENNGDTLSIAKANPDGSIQWKSRILSATASPTAKIESKTHDLVICEEAQDLEDRVIDKSIRPMLASTKGNIVFIGTGGTRKCAFLKTIKRNRRLRMKQGKRLHFYYPYTVCARYNPDYAAYIEMEKEKLGEDSDAFQLSYMCRFILERGMFITERFLFHPDVAVQYGHFRDFIPPNMLDLLVPRNFSIVAGLDFAKKADSTVLTFVAVDWSDPVVDVQVPDLSNPGQTKRLRLFKKHIVSWIEISGDDYDAQFESLMSTILSVKRLSKLKVDVTGVGEPMHDRMAAVLNNTGITLEPFLFSEQGASEIFKNFRSDLLQRRCTFPYSETSQQKTSLIRFVHQMLAAEKITKPNGIMKVAAPEEEDSHDDYVDSGALAVTAANDPVGHEATPDTVFYRKNPLRRSFA